MGMRSQHRRLLDQGPLITSWAKRAALLKARGQQACYDLILLNTATVGPPGAALGPRRGYGLRRALKLTR
jgi:hypothetical protein